LSETLTEDTTPAAGRDGPGLALRGFGWLAVYALVAVTPLVVALTADPPPGRDFWLEFSVGLGFVGLALMGLQFATVSRFSTLNAPFGLDVVLQYHRLISFTALAFVLAHPAIIVIRRPAMAEILNPITADWQARFGLLSLVSLLALVATSVWRKRLQIRYEVWRVAHGLLAVTIVVTALLHIDRVGYYVDGPWKRGLWLLMSAVFVALLVNVRIVKPLRLMRRPWRVTSVEPERGDCWTLTIEPDGHPGANFLAGQFAWLRIDRSPFSMRENPFSFSSSAEQTERVSFTIKEAGDFTSTIGSVEPGTRVHLDGPYGVFTHERNEGPRFVFVAGGVGIAPIISMLRTLADRGDRRPCLLLYGNPQWDEVIFREELERLRERMDLTVVHVIDDPPEGWTGESGFIDSDVLERHLCDDPRLERFFLCGPLPMMESVQENLQRRGVRPEHIELEQFDIV
jgi:predicted ferric reductase